MYDWEKFNEVLNLHCGFDLEHSNLLYSQDIPNCYNALSNEVDVEGSVVQK